ncbi:MULTISPECIES: TauD/TfdA family dioxygenase [Corynebacterium]|uniref:TauD/TfdA family dioxygenase n=1 Tax=Corynebacterium TaxID=1716 RepID=UPI0008A20B15|nr:MULTISPECIES: TauD/TfdA family dioxygenase [Corynebacterium]KAA0881606.1 oxygenase [Corynebacterium amycolatum]MCA0443852.1 TauD/TfdA family dioxygenase [Corynebacterium amycolatum]MDC7119576.1 TauD/TfdA family dioxygenase [Corynebacterium amycolatum]MDK7315871.1 TauD/TfdA family dioxygenase [Corynebacterium amycolatum]MDK8850705.1 TauD/TfdA family dioxygenase [Corynebacterium sp. MSK019]
MQHLHLSQELSHRIVKAADELAATQKISSPDSYNAINHLLTDELEELKELILLSPTAHATSIHGLPFPAVHGPTPATWQECVGKVRTWRFVLAIIASAVGRPFGWFGQQKGRITTDLVPTRGQENQQVGASSNTTLTLHTEDAFHPRRATHFALFGLRNPKNVGTTLAPIDEAWHLLDVDSKKILTGDGAIIIPDASYGDYEYAAPTAMTSIWKTDGNLGMRFDPAYTDKNSGTLQWWEAFEKLQQALHTVTYTVPIKPGQMVIINNDRCAHGRVPFVANYDGTDRWMLRINIMGTKNTRPINEINEPGYGQHIRFMDGEIL